MREWAEQALIVKWNKRKGRRTDLAVENGKIPCFFKGFRENSKIMLPQI